MRQRRKIKDTGSKIKNILGINRRGVGGNIYRFRERVKGAIGVDLLSRTHFSK